MSRWLVVLALVLTAVLDGDEQQSALQKERLAKLQSLVGDWRGVGQPQRGSTQDSWIEEAHWAWSFDMQGPALTAKLPQGKYFRELRLSIGPAAEDFLLIGTSASDGQLVTYGGRLNDQEQLILNANKTRDDLPRRITFRFVAGGARLLMLMEKKGPAGDQLVRLAEVGYTRQGSGFGKNTTQRECIVTGGLGTIEVSHEGKTYYVCCTGCRDYFNENPAKVLAEYAARKKAP